MTRKDTDKLEKDLVQAEEQLARERNHLQTLSEEYDAVSRHASAYFEEVSSLFRDSSDWAYYQNLTDQHDEQERQFQRGLQDRIDEHTYRQRQLTQQQAEFKEQQKAKGEH